MRKVKLIGRAFPEHLLNRIVDIVYEGSGYIIKSHPNKGTYLHIIPEWEILEVDRFNEYLKLIKQ